MAVYKNLKAVRRLTNSSLTAVIDVTNLNFNSLSAGTLEFLENIQYNETDNSFVAHLGTFDFADITDKLSLKLDGIPTFTIDSLGRAEGQELLVKVAETKRLRLTDFNDWPDVGVPGEIIYTGIQNQRPRFGEDFIGYLQGRGWVSLTGLGNGYIELEEIPGSPGSPGTPGPGQGFVWIGGLGLETAEIPTSQNLYFTDENGDVFNILEDKIWEKVGDDARFKPDGKVIIGDLGTNTKNLQYVDGNQQAGYILTSDANGNASWQQPNPGGAVECSFIWVDDFVATVQATVVHNLGTQSVSVTLIDTATNQIITGSVGTPNANEVTVTITQNLNLKVIILAADCGTTTVQKVVVEFNTFAGTPVNIPHGLGTQDLTFNVRSGNTLVYVDLTFIDDNNVTITTTTDVTEGRITLIG